MLPASPSSKYMIDLWYMCMMPKSVSFQKLYTMRKHTTPTLLPPQLGMAICYQYISPHLTKITSCFAASAGWSGVTPLILWASNTTTRFSSGSSNFCNFTPRLHKKQSQKVRNTKFSWEEGGGGAFPETPLAGALCTYAYWKTLFQNSRSSLIIKMTNDVNCTADNAFWLLTIAAWLVKKPWGWVLEKTAGANRC